MSKLGVIDNLRQRLGELRSCTAELNGNISDLQLVIDADEFIPDTLNDKICNMLVRIGESQREFTNQYKKLEVGILPLNLVQTEENIEEIVQEVEIRRKYTDILNFFLQIHSDDQKTEQLLKNRKQEIKTLEMDCLSVGELKSYTECYEWFRDAYNETDPKKKFMLLYKLADVFEVEIASGIQFGTLYLKLSDDVQDEVPHREPETLPDVNTDSSVGCTDKLWELLQIKNHELVIVKENPDLLHVETAIKANAKFGVKEFKSDIAKQTPSEKLACMTAAFEEGYSISSIAICEGASNQPYEIATDKLFQLGYLKKYIAEGIGEFYLLSTKGEKAFASKDSMAFINNHSKRKKSYSANSVYIAEEINSVTAYLLSLNTFSKIVWMNNNYKFRSISMTIGTAFFFRRFMSVFSDKNVLFAGIISEKASEFKSFSEALQEYDLEAEQLIITGLTQGQAKHVAEWISELFNYGADKAIWYCGYGDEGVMDLHTGDLVSLNIVSISKSEESVANDLVQTNEQRKDVITVAESTDSAEREVAIFLEADKMKYDTAYQQMLSGGYMYGASAYVKAVAKTVPYYEAVYRQLAYALNDPLENCSYSSDTLFHVYYTDDNIISDHFVIAAALRNYFMDQYSYDYSLQQLQALLAGNAILSKIPSLGKIMYSLQKFKTENHCGINRYADYHEKERASCEKRLEELRREARGYYDTYCLGSLKETSPHKRFIETGKLLLGQGSELSEYLEFVMNDDRQMFDLLVEFLKEYYIKDQAVICESNLDSGKIGAIIDTYWERAAQNMRLVKKTSDLMGSLRMNLFKRVSKVAGVLCNYVFQVYLAADSVDDPGQLFYKKQRTPLLNDIHAAIEDLKLANEHTELLSAAGNAVLLFTLNELESRLIGTYKEGSNKYFYINFLKNDKVLLNEDYLPVLDDVLELPEFSVSARIIEHCQEAERELNVRLDEIFSGQDDFGSAELILKYIQNQEVEWEGFDKRVYDLEKAGAFPQKDMENKRNEFIEDLELAQSYGQIDDTIENSKETIIQIMNHWYVEAMDSRNYGFFSKILKAFMSKIKKDAYVHAVELEKNLESYLASNSDWDKNELFSNAVAQIRERIEQQNYAAAEDLLNRLITNDLDLEHDFPQTDYLEQFLKEYDVNYRKISHPGATLKSLINTSIFNKDTKGANRLLESWPKGAGVSEDSLMSLLTALGFHTETVKAEALIKGKMESYVVTLKRPQNGRKSNYKHPVSAFGSEAEDKGFRVVCIFGRVDAERLVDTFKDIGNAKNTLVLLDFAISLPDRRKLARKVKTDLGGKIFAVIDRVVLVYLASRYTETAVNRMLMAVIMPFSFYQPYIDKSADVMPQEIFIGRKQELEKIESPTGVNIVYGGRQLGKTALLRMAKKDIDMNENGDRAVIVNVWGRDYRKAARTISEVLYDEKFLKNENITEDWNELARDIKNRLRDEADPIPYFLLMIDEADVFIESCEVIGYQPFDALKEIQSIGHGRFKFVVAGLRNIIRFKQTAALGNNSVLTHLDSLTVKPFKSMEARELLEVPLFYLGFRFPKDNETEILISTIYGTTNYFPGLIQLYCTKLIDALKRNYAGYDESETPPYIVKKEHIKKVLAEQSLQQDIREKFFITLKVDEDDYYYIIALLVAYHYHENRNLNGCSAGELLELSENLEIGKLAEMKTEQISALMEEMHELNVLQHTGDKRYRFARHSFCQMMGTVEQIDDELLNYMEV